MDLSTDYLGLKLRNPLIVGSAPFCDDLEMARRLDGEGAAAMVMRSLFEEQFNGSSPAIETPDAARQGEYQFSPEQYLRQVERLKGVLTIPVIASLNGFNPGGWTKFALRLEAAGADAIELNCYRVVTEPEDSTNRAETEMVRVLREIAQNVRIPVAVKLSPYHSSVADLVVTLELAGAAGIVVFNRFYQPDIDVETLEVQSQLRLSDSSELLLRLRWLAILSPLTRASLAATGGVHTAEDVIKALLAGAHAVQLVAVLLKQGPGVIPGLLASLQSWMQRRAYKRIDEFRGLLDLRHCPDSAAYERANYIRTLQSPRV